MGDENLMNDLESGAPEKAPEKVIASKKKPSSKASSSKTSKKAKSQGLQIPDKIDIIWAVALVVAAFVIGFFVRGAGVFESQKMEDNTLSPMMQSTPADVSGGQSQGGGVSAPALDESQLNQSVPSGHPSIDDADAGSGSAAPSSGSGKSDVPAAGSPDGNSVDVKKDPTK